MSNICDNCIDCNCRKCPVIGKEWSHELGMDERETSEDEE